MGEISLSARLPKGDANGLSEIARSLIQEPEKVHAVILLLDCKKIVTDVDNGETVPVARIRRCEAIRESDLREAQKLIRRAWEGRCGGEVLPIELEDDLQAIFKGIDVNVAAEQEKPGNDKPDDTSDDKHDQGPDFSSGN
jgi:hypothetical protein